MEKKIVAKIAQSNEINNFNRQLAKLELLRTKENYGRSYVVNQLFNISEANHKFKERIFDFLVGDIESQSVLVRMVVSGQSTSDQSLPYFLISSIDQIPTLVEIALLHEDYLEYTLSVKTDNELYQSLALKMPVQSLIENTTNLIKGFGKDENFASELWETLQTFQPKMQDIKHLANFCSLLEYLYQTNQALKTQIALKLCELVLQAMEKDLPSNLIRLLKAQIERIQLDSSLKPYFDMFTDYIYSKHHQMKLVYNLDQPVKVDHKEFFAQISNFNTLNQLPFQLINVKDSQNFVHSLDSSWPTSKLTFNTFDTYHLNYIFRCLKSEPNELKQLQVIEYALDRKTIPELQDIVTIDSFDHLKDVKVIYTLIQLLIKKCQLTSKHSAGLLLAIMIRNLPECLALAALTDFCLVKLDNKYFKIHQDLIESYLNTNSTEKDILFVCGLIRQIAIHPKTSFSAQYLDLLQRILIVKEQPRIINLVLSILADMINNGVLEFQITYQILTRKYSKAVQTGLGWMRVLESCKNEILELELGTKFYAFIEMDEEQADIFKVCCDVNRVVFDMLLPTENPVLIKDHIDYILNQGLQALLVKESNQNVDERFKAKQLDLWQQLLQVWVKTRDAPFLAELIRVDLKLKTESKFLRNIKFDQVWQNFNKDQVKSIAEKQLVVFGKLRLFGVFPKVVMQSLAQPDSLLQALALLKKADLMKVECVPFLTLNLQNPLTEIVINKIAAIDNQCIQMLCSQINLIKTPELFGQVIEELARYYLGTQTHYVGQILVNMFTAAKGHLDYAKRIVDTLVSVQTDRKSSQVITSLKQAVSTSKLYENLQTQNIEGQMVKERLSLLLGDSFVKVDKSDASLLMQTMWLSNSAAEYEGSDNSVGLDLTLSRIKNLLKKQGKDENTIILCAATGTYLLRTKPDQTFLMYLTSLSKETEQPLLYRYGVKFRALFTGETVDLADTLVSWGKMAASMRNY